MARNWGIAETWGRSPGWLRGPAGLKPGQTRRERGSRREGGSYAVPPGREKPKSGRVVESESPATPAHSRPRPISGAGTSAAPPPRPPHPGCGSRRPRGFASTGSTDEPEPEPTPQRPGRGRGSRPALGGGTAPQPHLRGILVYSVPPPPSSARPAVPSAAVAPGPPITRGRHLPPVSCALQALSAGLSTRPAPSVTPCSKATQRALNAAHIPPLRLRPPARPAASSAWNPGATRLHLGNLLCPLAEQAAKPPRAWWRECGNKKKPRSVVAAESLLCESLHSFIHLQNIYCVQGLCQTLRVQ